MKKIKQVLLLLLSLALLLSCGGCGVDDTPVLSVSGDGVTQELSFSLAQLQEVDSQQLIYSTLNNFPSKKYVTAEGCTLAALLQPYLSDAASLITVTADDGYSQSFSLEQLLGAASYYDLGGNAHPVESMLAWAYADDADAPPQQTEAIEGLRLLLGQYSPHAPNAMAGVQNVSSIEVSCEPLAQLPPCDFSLTSDGSVEFVYENMDQCKIYYTTDGSEPLAASSPVYNPSTSNFQPELNAPLQLSSGVLVRARVVAYGWLDSEISEYAVQ